MRSRLRGYSLIEVLIAFAIMTLVLAVLLPGQTRLLSRATLEQDRLLAADWAMSEMDAFGLEAPVAEGRQTRQWNDWTLTLSISADQTTEGLYIFEAQVADRRGTSLADLALMRYSP